jgi:hypothetical protein
MALFELPQNVLGFLDSVRQSQRRQAEALELMASELSDIGTLLEEIREALEENAEEPERPPRGGSPRAVSGSDGSGDTSSG